MSFTLRGMHQGYEIRWDEGREAFCIYRSGERVGNYYRTLALCRGWIAAQTKCYQRAVLCDPDYGRNVRPCTATHLVDDHTVELAVGRRRLRIFLESVWLDTPDNRELAAKLQKTEKQIAALRAERLAIERAAPRLTKKIMMRKPKGKNKRRAQGPSENRSEDRT